MLARALSHLLHVRHDRAHNRRVLLVGREVEDHVGGRDELLVRAHLEAVGRRVDVRRALRVDRLLPQRVANVAAGVTHVEALVEALRAAADDDDLLAGNRGNAVGELAAAHEAAASELIELRRLRDRIVIVDAAHSA